MCSPKLYRFKICSNFHIHEKINKNCILLRIYICAKKGKNSSYYLSKKKCKLSYVISYRCLNLTALEIFGGLEHAWRWYIVFECMLTSNDQGPQDGLQFFLVSIYLYDMTVTLLIRHSRTPQIVIL